MYRYRPDVRKRSETGITESTHIQQKRKREEKRGEHVDTEKIVCPYPETAVLTITELRVRASMSGSIGHTTGGAI